jgi:NADH-quinone oxidoreductase subunit E
MFLRSSPYALRSTEDIVLAEKYRAEIDRILAKYPADQKRSAVMPLLYLAQSEYGYISEGAMAEVGSLIGLTPTEVGGLVGFYSLYYDRPGGKRRMQICTDFPCALRGAEKFAEAVCKQLGVKLGQTTQDGEWTVEEVMCLAACDKAPMFQVQDASGIHYHESESYENPMTVEQALGILEGYQGKQ